MKGSLDCKPATIAPRGADCQTPRPANRIIEGKVTDSGGKPISGAHVVLRADDDVIQPNGVIVPTSPDGRYSADISRYEWSRSAGSAAACWHRALPTPSKRSPPARARDRGFYAQARALANDHAPTGRSFRAARPRNPRFLLDR